MDTLIGQWQDVCVALKDRLGEGVAGRWLSKITPRAVVDNRVCLTVPSPCVCEMIQQNFADPILSAWRQHDPSIEAISFSVRPAVQPPLVLQPAAAAQPIAAAPAPVADEVDDDIPCRLNPHYTFDTFVVGQTNQFAYAAAQKVAADDSAVFNPLYIHSAVGLGKTHLMQAIAWRMKETCPDKSVLYLSSEEFFHRFIKAIRTNAGARFAEQFRSVDVLMIDDLQFIVGKNRTQEEFFHTFNHLTAMGKK
ncbi:MAG: DnaA/Hda family protein, partial [Alphaproteobacteria bacterium]|nr:DnaA/Hda family protein [Alphaproteobacteria bacterium]